ncbi:MAG: hypothetical protein KKF44_06560 [Nanoarchaeota archaeon]|nr:hypothetical protein [Nanoarchaeota archaeon]
MVRSKRYAAWVRQRTRMQTVLLIILVCVLILFVYVKMKPVITELPVKDSCGPIGNTISHSIGDSDMCENSCDSACRSFELKFYKSRFVYKNEAGCNDCICQCKE